MRLEGIHHISAITGDATRNVDFYARVLGLRLVAKTVNQDDPSVYHLFYADELGRPGAEMTFFEYPRAIPGRAGAGMVHTVVWRVASADALPFWETRLAAEGVATERTSEGRLRFADPEGLHHELAPTATSDTPLAAEDPDVPAEHALQGFDGVRAYSLDPAASARLLTELLGAEAGPGAFELRGAARGATIAFDPAPAEPGRQSAGIVHHVAWHTTVDEHPRWVERITAAGIPNSGVVDRHYFKALYFREPGGILYEISDDAPGFTVDSPLAELGRRIILPPRFEPQRERIEARLTPLPDPRAGR
jgi:glyoxalase family protein